MSKKKDRFGKGGIGKISGGRSEQPSVSIKFEGVSKRGWKVIGCGIGIVTVGFYVLSLTDPAGQNWASNLSPFLLLGGYATIAVGIVLPEKKEND